VVSIAQGRLNLHQQLLRPRAEAATDEDDHTSISIIGRFKIFTRRLLGGKKKVLFEEPFKEGCNEIL
jgi:hypothetical protein